MTYNDLIRHFGTEVATANAIGGSRQMVHNWSARPDRPIPLDKQIAYEEATGGQLRAALSAKTRHLLSLGARVAA